MEALINIIRKYRLIAAVIGLLTGWCISEALNFLSDYRQIVDREIAEVQNGAEQVQNSLALLAKVANGKENISRDVVVEFDTNIINLHQRSESLSGLLPEVRDVLEEYKRSMLVLSDSVGELTGPENAKKFVESTSEWNYRKKKFDEEINAVRTDFSLIPKYLFR